MQQQQQQHRHKGRRVGCGDDSRALPEGFRLLKRLGQGGQATVYLAQDMRPDAAAESRSKPTGLDPARYDPTKVAVKCYARSVLTDPAKRKQVRREIRCLRTLKHPHVIGFRELLLSRTHLCLVIDYAAGGSLYDVLCGKKTEVLHEGVARRLFQQLMTGVDYAHGMGFTNRDIKPENVLFYPVPVGKAPMLVLCDFGLSRRDESGLISKVQGTSGYVAPELYTGQCKTVDQAKRAEIYSCGVCLFQMLFGLAHFPSGPESGSKRMDVKSVRDWLHGEPKAIALPDLRPISDECRDFLNGILQPNPKNRISMSQIWTHPWFKTSLSDEALEWNRCLIRAQSVDKEELSAAEQTEELLDEACPANKASISCGFHPIKQLAALTKLHCRMIV